MTRWSSTGRWSFSGALRALKGPIRWFTTTIAPPVDVVIGEDSPDSSVLRAVRIVHDTGVKVVIISGCGDSCKEATIKWMKKCDVPFDDIHMRRADDQRADWIVKDELVRDHTENRYHVIWFYDDRNQVVDHHRAMGYQVFQVAPGDF